MAILPEFWGVLIVNGWRKASPPAPLPLHSMALPGHLFPSQDHGFSPWLCPRLWSLPPDHSPYADTDWGAPCGGNTGLLNLGTTDLEDSLSYTRAGGGVCPLHCRVFAASLASTHQKPVASSVMTTKNISRRHQMFPGGAESPLVENFCATVMPLF